MRSLGPGRAAATARALGDLYRKVDRRHRAVALDNVENAFPDLSGSEHDRIVKGSFRSLALAVVEFLYMERCLTPRSFHHRVSTEGFERVREALGGRGAVLVSGHFGNWEVLGATLGLLGAPLNSVARPIDNPLIDRYLHGLRSRYGQSVIEKSGALRTMVGLLKQGKFLGMLVDQDAGRHGIFVDFMGRAASTITTPAALAVRLGVPIVTGCCVRIGREPFSFRLVADEPIEPDPGADRDLEIRRMTEAVSARLERLVRQYPEQYLWQHRRWKTRPPEETGKKPRRGARWSRG